ncbi:SelT/SelW/SelH family protein [Asaia sp. As-1742]|uniref:SelT/SelW/SelH family protein n=1 Tax=Asaia sp. As-1742 TaxID=2608325 RepID=UPI00141F0950|nr:SelT/SelW/SelH family protein [Asaia sp. As-1742]NIE80516.1 SelT/SelW/SelH family protein [Asaia sp. As-1742]
MQEADPVQPEPRFPADRVRITIRYCTQCNWMLRSAWIAQELLQSFGTDLGEVALVPDTGGHFSIMAGEHLIWERKRDGGFPGPKDIKQRVRDVIAPERDLGHIDR